MPPTETATVAAPARSLQVDDGAVVGRARAEQALLRAGRHPVLPAIERGLRAATRAAGLDEEAPLLLLVSGGSDSMALLLAMCAIAQRHAGRIGRISVLSVDHGLRPEAATECDLARRWATALGVQRASVERVQVDPSGNVLAAARVARYEAARRLQVELGAGAIVCAHQAEDRVETALLALARGGAAEAVVGLRRARLRLDLASTPAVAPAPWVLRPLLGVVRRDLRALLESSGVPWVEDPSNRTRSRGALRAEEATAAWIAGSAARGGEALDELEQLLAWRSEVVARTVSSWERQAPREALAALDPALRVPVVQAFIRRESSRLAGSGRDAPRAVLLDIAGVLESGDLRPRRWPLGAAPGGRPEGECEIRLDRSGLSIRVGGEITPRRSRGR